jgi:hypothetical protein
MRSNLSLRSNVCIGSVEHLKAGGKLIRHVRGRKALRKLLARLEPGRPAVEAARMHLRPEQTAELLEDACLECGFFTVGPVATPNGPVLEVRCPRNTCVSSIRPTRALLIDRQMTQHIASLLSTNPTSDLSGVVARALSNGHSHGSLVLEQCARTAVRLPAHLYYRYYTHSDQQFSELVKHCLAEAVGNG